MTELRASRSVSRWFAGFMYVCASILALLVAAAVHGIDSFFAHSWLDPDKVAPLAYAPLTAVCTGAGVALLAAGAVSLRWPRAAVFVAAAAWLAGLAAPLLLPWWQRSRGVEPFGGWDLFAAAWLVVLVPLCLAAVYGVVLERRSVNGASA